MVLLRHRGQREVVLVSRGPTRKLLQASRHLLLRRADLARPLLARVPVVRAGELLLDQTAKVRVVLALARVGAC